MKFYSICSRAQGEISSRSASSYEALVRLYLAIGSEEEYQINDYAQEEGHDYVTTWVVITSNFEIFYHHFATTLSREDVLSKLELECVPLCAYSNLDADNADFGKDFIKLKGELK